MLAGRHQLTSHNVSSVDIQCICSTIIRFWVITSPKWKWMEYKWMKYATVSKPQRNCKNRIVTAYVLHLLPRHAVTRKIGPSISCSVLWWAHIILQKLLYSKVTERVRSKLNCKFLKYTPDICICYTYFSLYTNTQNIFSYVVIHAATGKVGRNQSFDFFFHST